MAVNVNAENINFCVRICVAPGEDVRDPRLDLDTDASKRKQKTSKSDLPNSNRLERPLKKKKQGVKPSSIDVVCVPDSSGEEDAPLSADVPEPINQSIQDLVRRCDAADALQNAQIVDDDGPEINETGAAVAEAAEHAEAHQITLLICFLFGAVSILKSPIIHSFLLFPDVRLATLMLAMMLRSMHIGKL